MVLRFLYEAIVGFLTFVAILLFGEKGFAVFALLAILPVIMRVAKVKADERELLLFYRAGNVTLAATMLAIILIHFTSGWTVNGHLIGDHWMQLSVAAVLFCHGIIGWLFLKFA